MRILKLLNKKKLLFIFLTFCLLGTESYSNEPIDIWNLEPRELEVEVDASETENTNSSSINSVYEIQSQKNNGPQIEEDESLFSNKIEIVGLFDPAENGLTIDMWSNSDGNKILDILSKIYDVKLSKDAIEILNILFLTNSYPPTQNITDEKFFKIKTDWLIKNNDLDLIENYLLKNQDITLSSELMKFLVDEYLSQSQVENSCNAFSKINVLVDDDYLSKFNIYCLINFDKREEAQLQFDLKKELGFKDDFFEKKFNYLMEYETINDNKISDKSILNFHLSYLTHSNFSYEPNETTSKKIWKYLSTSNLLENTQSINLDDQKRIKIIEKATHERNYNEKELYDLYKRFQFNINQLLTVKESYKLLSDYEARALLYQGILITSKVESKIELIKILKNIFIKEGIENAFKDELREILKKLNVDEIPSNYLSFYDLYVNEEEENISKIKINNNIIHQSKLINYFRTEIEKKNIEKDLNNLLKKIKKNKKYYVSLKDIILLESLKSDGVEILKKYQDLYEIDDADIPSDIQVFIDNNETGMVLLRLVQIIGQDELKDIGPETLYFIISALNQLDIDPLRNKILLKILPLKV